MNEHFINRQLYQVGQFYQLDSFNPVYLDKTGELIAQSEGRLVNWNGNLNEFHFSDESKTYNGKVNIQQYWYSNPRQGDYDEKELDKFISFIKPTNELIDSVYKPKYYSRIGLRVQYILKKTSDSTREKYKHFYDDKLVKMTKFGCIESTGIGFDLKQEEISIRVNLNLAKKSTENDLNAPKDGLLFDLDFYRIVDKKDKSETFDYNNKLLSYAVSSYKEIICVLAEEMGII